MGRHFPSPPSTSLANLTDAAPVSNSRTRHFNGKSSEITKTTTKTSQRTIHAKPSEPRVSIPISSVVGILSSKQPGLNGFEHYEQSMSEALTLLGTTDDEKSRVMELMSRTKNDLFQAERKVIQPNVLNDHEVSIDLREMDNAASAIIERTRSGLKSILQQDIGDALDSTIDWNNFYRPNFATDPGAVRFRIRRDVDGGLIYEVSYSNGGSIMGKSEGLNDDGNAIRADEVFPERWRPLLKGIELQPLENP